MHWPVPACPEVLAKEGIYFKWLGRCFISKEVSSEQVQRRKLAAIMFTDIVGYSAMSARNELDALNAISDYEQTVRPILSSHNGLEIKSLGDGSLIEFESALDAMRCAIEIQRAMHERNGQVPEDRVICLRIGLHVGEIIHREGDVFGDGVNVAARVQPLAPPEGVCFTEDVWRLVKDKLPVQVVRLGAGEMKNLGRSIPVYRIRFPWDTTTVAGDRTGLALRRKRTRWTVALAGAAVLVAVGVFFARRPSRDSTRVPEVAFARSSGDTLVVLPFKNLSDDPKLDYWGDGLTEELISALSTVPRLGVMGRETAWSFKGKATDVREICRSLGVSAALEGTVRRELDHIRVAVRMTDGRTGLTLWSAKYDEQTKDVFKVQERIATAVLARLQSTGDQGATPKTAASVNALAYDAYLQGRANLRQFDLDRDKDALANFKKAIELDDRFAPAYVGLATAYYMHSNVVLPPNEAMPKMREAAMKAIELDPNLADAHVMLGVVRQNYDWDWAAAEAAFESALRFGPGNASAHHYFGDFLITQGRFEEAFDHLKTSLRLDPQALDTKPSIAFGNLLSHRYDEAIRVADDILVTSPGNAQARMVIADCHLESGRPELAEPIYRKLNEQQTNPIRVGHLVLAYSALGQHEKANHYLRVLEKMDAKHGFVGSYVLGLAYGAVGRRDDAFRQWERAFHDRSENMVNLAVDPHMDKYRKDPRFKRLQEMMKLPVVEIGKSPAS